MQLARPFQPPIPAEAREIILKLVADKPIEYGSISLLFGDNELCEIMITALRRHGVVNIDRRKTNSSFNKAISSMIWRDLKAIAVRRRPFMNYEDSAKLLILMLEYIKETCGDIP
jgi:hypothetical protein